MTIAPTSGCALAMFIREAALDYYPLAQTSNRLHNQFDVSIVPFPGTGPRPSTVPRALPWAATIMGDRQHHGAQPATEAMRSHDGPLSRWHSCAPDRRRPHGGRLKGLVRPVQPSDEFLSNARGKMLEALVAAIWKLDGRGRRQGVLVERPVPSWQELIR